MKNQNGFTLIELVIVIVLLGVLAAIAVPRFVNLQDDALLAQRNATAAAISSAMNINYAACAVNNFTVVPGGDCRAVTACTNAVVEPLLANAGTSLTDYTVGGAAIPTGNGSVQTCTLERTGVLAPHATFTAVRTAP